MVERMFADPELLSALRRDVVPHLRTYPTVRAWVPACGAGEDAFGVAIVLREEGLLERSFIYATDTDEEALARGRAGAFPVTSLSPPRYEASGGRASLSEYFADDGITAMTRPLLSARILFAEHDLATDGSFNEFHLIVLRRALPLRLEALRRRAFSVLEASLRLFGFFTVGATETTAFVSSLGAYSQVGASGRIYRRIR